MGIAEAQGEVQTRGRTDKGHHVDAGLRVDVDKSYLACLGIAGVVKQSYLHTTWVALCHVDDADLRAPQCVGIVIGAELQSPHASGTDVGDGGELHSLPHAHGDVGNGTEL